MTSKTGCRLIATVAVAVVTVPIAAQDASSGSVRPVFKPLPFEEDRSRFDPAGAGDADFWDPIKHVRLSEDGAIWASFGGELRGRVEAWRSFGFLDDDTRDDVFGLGRMLLHADVHAGERFRVFVEGESTHSTDRDLPGGRRTLDADTLDLQNAFADAIIPLGDGIDLTARLGRQELLFGKQRLVSPLPWSNSQRSWDAARAIVSAADWRLDAFASRFTPVEKYGFNDWEGGADFHGVYATGKLGEQDDYTVDGYWLYLDADTASFAGVTGDERRHTLGGRIAGPLGPLSFDTEAAYQLGEIGDSDIGAWMVGAELAYAPREVRFAPRMHVGFDYASGDDDPADGDVNTFNQLYPLGHAYFGGMDFIGRQNIIDASAGVSLKPCPRLTVRSAVHFFWRASDEDAVYNAGGGVLRSGGGDASEIGQELDFVASYGVDRHLTLEGGYSHFFAGDFLEQSGPADDVDWVYVQVTYRF